MDTVLENVPFADPDQAQRALDALTASGHAELEALLTEALLECGDPDRGLLGVQRYIELCAAPADEFEAMATGPRFLQLLTTIFAQSTFLSEIIFRHPENALWLWQEAALERSRSTEEMLGDLFGESGFPNFEAACSGMRRFRQREILRIGTRDIFAHAPIESITEDLSNLADAALEAALQSAAPELEARYGQPTAEDTDPPAPASFTVLAMGKLGGCELNFSSDIDLLFIYSEEGETVGGRSRPVTNAEYFKKLGEAIIKALSEQTAEGIIFRVDMRLRPYGRSGPLAVAFDNAVEYYAECGRAWERQAMIKARPCAGDLDLGRAFLDRLRPFVYPRYFDDATLEDIRETKAQAEIAIRERGTSDREVKLGPGGIRDIEFTVQMLQLLNGGRTPDLRKRNSLAAIQALGQRGKLTPFEANALAAHYRFLRQVEHRIQIEGGRQCHALPEDARALDTFARRLGYEDGAAFLRIYRDRTAETRSILERFLTTKGAGNLWVGDLLNPLSEGTAGLARLKEMGFSDPERAREELISLSNGPDHRPLSRDGRQRFAGILPFMLNALSFTGDPDAILMRLEQILGQLPAPATAYELLKLNPALCHFLVTLVWNSQYLCNLLIRDVSMLELVSSVDGLTGASTRRALRQELASLRGAHDSDTARYRLRDGEMLRVAMRELGRNISVAQVGDELTQLAEVILGDALWQAHQKVAHRFGEAGVPFAILGLGKLGGWEMGYGSDLDLVFVYEANRDLDCGMPAVEYFAAVASQTLRILKEPTRYGTLYDIDARLRPDGSKGTLAIGHDRLDTYYRQEAQDWERHALMKARAAAGDRAFGKRIEGLAKDVAFGQGLDRASLEQIEDLRLKALEQASPRNLKKAEGGIGEIEFATRFWQLQHVGNYPELKRGDVFGALDILDENDLVDPAESKTLREAYGALRRILNRIRMVDGGSSASLPKDPRAQEDLATRLGIQGSIAEYAGAYRERVHAIYKRVYEDALSRAKD